MEKLYRLSLREAARRIREGSLTAADLVRACLTSCSRLEARVQAWEHLDAGRALERAEELDAVRKSGRVTGPLNGIALGIKDIIDVAGMPTTMGSPVYAGRVARETAAVVRQVEQAGAIVIGKTVTSEFAYYTPRKTRNRLQQIYARFLAGFDALVTPPATGEAPADLNQTGDPTFCTIWTLLGAPALAIPVGLGPHGLPLGLQVVATCGRDDAALAAAAWCERVFTFAGLRD